MTGGAEDYDISQGQARFVGVSYSLQLVQELVEGDCGFAWLDPALTLQFAEVGQIPAEPRGAVSLKVPGINKLFYRTEGWVRIDTITDSEILGAMAIRAQPNEGPELFTAVGGFAVPLCP